MKFINTYKSPNFNLRAKESKIKFIILHYTAMYSLEETLNHLCNPKSKVSSHFLVSKKGDIYNIVDLDKRSWHAGKSFWKDIVDINSYSIGIEIENTGHYLNFENYSNIQIKALSRLIKKLKLIYKIRKTNILGHSDVSPMRKLDPGQKFPWFVLKRNRLVYLPIIKKLTKKNRAKSINLIEYKKMLKCIGYNIKIDNKKDRTLANVTKAFQMHYQQNFVTGYPNLETFLLAEKCCKDMID